MIENYFNQQPFQRKLKQLASDLGVDFNVLAVAASVTATILEEVDNSSDEGILIDVLQKTLPYEAIGRKLVDESKGGRKGAISNCVAVYRAFQEVPGWSEYVYQTGPCANNCISFEGRPKPNCDDALTMIDYQAWMASRRKKVTRGLSISQSVPSNSETRHARRAAKHMPDERDWIPR